VYRLKGK
jgi:hypothetical protein